MIALAIVGGLLVLFLLMAGIGLLLGPEPSSDEQDEDKLRAGLELHAIRRNLDVSYLKHQSRTEAQRLRREFDQELDTLDQTYKDE